MSQLRRSVRSLLERSLASKDAVRSVRSSGAFVFLQVLGVGVAYVGNVVLARLLGAAEFGLFTYVFNWRAFLTVPGLAGLGGGTLRFIPAYVGRESWTLLAGFVRFSRATVVVASLFTALATASIVAWIWKPSEPIVHVFWWAAASLAFQVLILQSTNVLRALNRVVASQLPQLVLQPFLQIALFAAAVFVGAPRSASSAMVAVLIAGALVAVLVVALEGRSLPDAARAIAPSYEPKVWVRSMVPLLWIQGIAMAMDRADVLVLGTIAGPTQAGVYSAASRIASLVGFGTAAVSVWAAPGFSERHAREDKAGLQDLVRIAARLIFFLTLPATIGVWVLGPFLLGLFGSGFESALHSLLILTFGQLVGALVGPAGFLLPMTGGELVAARMLAVCAGLNLVLNVALVPLLGMEGAAIGTSVARVVQAALLALAVWRRLEIRTTIV